MVATIGRCGKHPYRLVVLWSIESGQERLLKYILVLFIYVTALINQTVSGRRESDNEAFLARAGSSIFDVEKLGTVIADLDIGLAALQVFFPLS